MKKTVFALALLVILSAGILPPRDFVRTEIYEGVSVDLPKSFQPMTEAQLQENYLAARRPLAAYTDPNQPVVFGLNVSNTRWQPGDLPMLKDFYQASLLELYDEVKFLAETVQEVNGQPFAVFEFVSVVRADEDETSFINQKPIRRYTYVQYTVHQQKTWVFDFSVPAQDQSTWQPVARHLMESVRMSSN
jgi:hypothetical protein